MHSVYQASPQEEGPGDEANQTVATIYPGS